MKIFSTGILGMNARNLLYIKPFNRSKAIQLADNKLQSKEFFRKHQIPSARVYKVISNKKELEQFTFDEIAAKSFVIKPNRGFGGQGIKIVLDRQALTEQRVRELKAHIAEVLDGNFSLSNAPDVALIEQRIICHPELASFSYKGLPDLRVIVHNLIPVMAMLRLPTKESDGKANYHAGGAIAGIDLATGKIIRTLIHGEPVEFLPEQTTSILGYTIPNWDQILLIASKAQLYSNIGYLAIDIVLNKKGEPLVLEMNARGGLAIQIANNSGLRERLDRIQGLKIKDPIKGVRIGKELFGSNKTTETLEDEIKEMTGKEILGSYEVVELSGARKPERTIALVDTSKIYTSIDKKLAIKQGVIPKDYEPKDTIEFFKAKLTIGSRTRRTFVTIKDYSNQTYKIVIGRRNLRDTLIDPFRGLPETYLNVPKVVSSGLEQEKEADKLLEELYSKFNFLEYIKPINLAEEYQKWKVNKQYTPQLIYQSPPDSHKSMLKELDSIPQFDSDIGIQINLRTKELITQIKLISSIGSSDYQGYSELLFPRLTANEVSDAINQTNLPIAAKDEKRIILDSEDIQRFFQNTLEKIGLNKWKVKIDTHGLSTIRIKSNSTIAIPEGKRVAQERLWQLAAHEILAHALIKDNSLQQKWRIFSYGFPGYIYSQEGLAVVHEIISTPELSNTIKRRSARYALLTEKARSIDGTALMAELLTLYTPLKAWRLFIKMKRGITDTNQIGSFGREAIYFQGLRQFPNQLQPPAIFYSGRISTGSVATATKYNSLPHIIIPDIVEILT